MRYLLITLLLVSAMGCTARPADPGDVPQAAEMRIMSFNIRYPNPRDGANFWPFREQLVFDTIKAFGPDVLGVQEALRGQADAIDAQMPGYSLIAVGRDDGKDAGEMAAIYFRDDRFERIEHGHFWLSDNPETPGSVGWDASLPRIATWVLLREKHTEQGVLVLNTHFDHRGQTARAQSAALIRERVLMLTRKHRVPAIVMGDYNCAPDSTPYQALIGADPPKFLDTYRQVHRASTQPEGTFNGFRGRNDGARIDWILVTEDVQIIDAAIDRTNDNGRYPSDHYPVTAVLRLAP